MKRPEILKTKISAYLKKTQLTKDKDNIKLERSFLIKARKNLAVANLLMKISDDDDLKKTIGVAEVFESHDWVIIVAYYAMYTSALAALARQGFKSKSHAATLVVLEQHYLHEQKKLETKHLAKLSKAYMISEAMITKLIQTKTRRETAQYDATPAITKENAKASLKDADEFITKIEEILS
ncbi:HEPN domain-containing protein [Candidatus Woesearchaeota archaeon]|nr:HEPN domain-containing protein [Candidatus Woesearchaeota archaeon]